MADEIQDSTSPNWSPTLKLIVGLTFVGIIATLVFSFRSLIGPLLLSMIITYMLHPLAARLSNATNLSWKVSANLVFLLLVVVLVGFSTATGVVVVQQIQSLIRVVQRFVNDLPEILNNLSSQVYILGPFRLDFSQYLDLSSLSDQVISTLQLLISRAGTLASTFATGAATTIGWSLFVLVVAYFVLVDAGKVPDAIHYIQIPGYDADIRRMGRELGRIWNAFLRGQLIIVILVVICYTVLMTILGLRYALGIAILAGLARFVPYLGPFTMLLVTALVAFFQPSHFFGLPPFLYTVLVVVSSIILDQVFDNLVSPRILGQSLNVHPAAVLVAAIIAANLIGIIGLVLAAPVLATLKLVGRYTVRKMFDLEPWPNFEEQEQKVSFPWRGMLIQNLFLKLRARIRK